MANYTVSLSGEFDDIKRRLAFFPDRLRNKILRGGLRAGAVELRKGARARAPRGQTRQLLQSIRVSMRNYRPDKPQADIKVGGLITKKSRKGVRKIDAYYSHMVEIGVKPHPIEASARRALTIRSGMGRVAFRRSARHPGFAGRRFMQATRIQDSPEAVRSFERYVAQRARAYIERGREPETVR